MFDSLWLAINVVAPMCVLIGLGYFVQQRQWVSEKAFKEFNTIVFRYLIPVVLMKNIIETDLSVTFQPKLILFAVMGILVMTGVLWLVVPRLEKEPKRIGVIIQAIVRSNFVLFGLTIATNMYGADQVGVTSLLISICVPLYNVISVIVLQYYSADEINFVSIFKGIITNPMLIGTMAGFVILLLGIPLPVFAKNTISQIAAMSTPLALLVMGGTFHFAAVQKNRGVLTVITLLRLWIIPGIFVGLGSYFGYRQIELLSLLVCFGCPVAVASYPMALAMHADDELASQALLVTTVISIFSMIFWLSLLTGMQLI